MVSIGKWLFTALLAGAVFASPGAYAIPLGETAAVSFNGDYGYDGGAGELSVNLGPAFNGQDELQSVDGNVPVPNGFVFDLAPGASNTGDFFDLGYDRSQIDSSPTPGSETGTFRFTIDSIVSFDLSGMATSIWIIELEAIVSDISLNPVYDDGQGVRVIIAGSPLNQTPIIQVRISSDSGITSSDIPEAGPIALLASGLIGMVLVRRKLG